VSPGESYQSKTGTEIEHQVEVHVLSGDEIFKSLDMLLGEARRRFLEWNQGGA
jgi:hypothetical protein